MFGDELYLDHHSALQRFEPETEYVRPLPNTQLSKQFLHKQIFSNCFPVVTYVMTSCKQTIMIVATAARITKICQEAVYCFHYMPRFMTSGELSTILHKRHRNGESITFQILVHMSVCICSSKYIHIFLWAEPTESEG